MRSMICVSLPGAITVFLTIGMNRASLEDIDWINTGILNADFAVKTRDYSWPTNPGSNLMVLGTNVKLPGTTW